jgi:hypothetical protein
MLPTPKLNSPKKKSQNDDDSFESEREDGVMKQIVCTLSFESTENHPPSPAPKHTTPRTLQKSPPHEKKITTDKPNKPIHSHPIHPSHPSRPRPVPLNQDLLHQKDSLNIPNSTSSEDSLDRPQSPKKRKPIIDLSLGESENSTEELNQLFMEDESKFIGKFICSNNEIEVIRGFINASHRGDRLFWTKIESVKRVGAAKGNLIMYHGLNHSGKFIDLGIHFAYMGFVVHLVDLRGFGYSGGLRFNSSMQELHKDLVDLLKLMNPKMPLYLYGHSIGATVL